MGWVVCRPNRLHFFNTQRSEATQPLVGPGITIERHEHFLPAPGNSEFNSRDYHSLTMAVSSSGGAGGKRDEARIG